MQDAEKANHGPLGTTTKDTQVEGIPAPKWHKPGVLQPARQDTCFFFNEKTASRTAECKTVVIFGDTRGGTTSVAGLARGLGLHLGDDLPINLEDQGFHKAPEDLPGEVLKRNAARNVWGFKCPFAAEFLDLLMPVLENPRFVLVTRDPAAIAMSKNRRADLEIMQAMERAISIVSRNFSLCMRLGVPTLVVSYERLLQNPRRTTRQLAQFLDVTARDELVDELAASVKAGHYNRTPPGGAIVRRPKKTAPSDPQA